MRKQVEYYCGEQITDDVLVRTRDIARKSDNGWIFSMYDDIESLSDLCCCHNSYPDEEYIVLGEDWFITYTIDGNKDVYISQWACVDDRKDNFDRTIEMMKAMKKIFIENAGLTFYSGLRHDTSFRFYERMIRRGFIQEKCRDSEINENSSEGLERVLEDITLRYGSVDAYLERGDFSDFPDEFKKLIFHDVEFVITDKFVKQYKKSS